MIEFSAYYEKLDGPEKERYKKSIDVRGLTLTRLESIPNITTKSIKMAPDDWM